MIFVSMRLPNYYQSDALIYMRPPQVSSALLPEQERPEDSAEKFQAITQEILSRARLRSILEKHEVYPELTGLVGLEKAIQRLQEEVHLEPVSAPGGQQFMQSFKLSFVHHDPKIAYYVMDAIANLFVEESIVNQQAEVLGTKEFLDSQLQSARQLLEKTEAEVQGFISKNFGKLPEHLDQAVARLQNAQTQRATNSQIISANIQRRQNLSNELALVQQAGVLDSENSPGSISNDPRANLAQLKKALQFLQSKYSEQHPDIINTKRRIEVLERQIAATGSGAGKSPTVSLSKDSRTIRSQINELDVEITRLTKENKDLEATIQKLEADIEAMPAVDQQLVKIKRDYATVRDNYTHLLAASKDAELRHSLVRSQKGAQFKIVEPPVIPILPKGPNRTLIAGLGVLGSFIILLVVPLMLYYVNHAFKFRDEVEKELDLQVFGVIPPMNSPDNLAEKRRLHLAALVVGILSCVSGGLAILIIV
jgi:polysaccharide chain length determinant protein (PEP-CTERM system associated)